MHISKPTFLYTIKVRQMMICQTYNMIWGIFFLQKATKNNGFAFFVVSVVFPFPFFVDRLFVFFREKTLRAFKQGLMPVLVGTDVASR